jgi:TatD DNase family protein
VVYFDTHCHLNHEAFQNDLDQVIEKALKCGVKYFVVPGWDVESSKRAIELSEKYPQILAAVGIHPTDWQKADEQSIETINQLALHPRVAAIGEIGLDFHHDPEHIKEQGELLLNMLSIADKVNKPVLLHSRESIEEMVKRLKEWKTGSNTGILHSFEGNIDQANVLIKMGFRLGVGGPLTYNNSINKKFVFSKVPIESIVFETDAPYLPPVPHRGDRNEPSYLPLVGEELARIRNLEITQILDSVYINSTKMFL